MLKTREKRLKKSTRAIYRTGANAIIASLKKNAMSYSDMVEMLRQRGSSRTVIAVLKNANLIKITGQNVSIDENVNNMSKKGISRLLESGLKGVNKGERSGKNTIKSSIKTNAPKVKNDDNNMLADIVVKLINTGQIKKAHEIAGKIK